MKNFATSEGLAPALLDWWDIHGRKDLPWQVRPTPYRVWVSEIMLQQTQVATVVRFYRRFMDAFPDIRTLADADRDQVLHLWSGLGYYARARNLHRAAGMVRDEYAGEMPTDLDSLTALPGIGRSTAGAILALSLDQPLPILDGNARRVLARVFGVKGRPGSSPVNRDLWRWAEKCTPVIRAGHYTQAIMDLGASTCTRRNPDCAACPLQAGCVAFRDGLVAQIPGPQPGRTRPSRAVVLAMVIRADGAILLEKRPSSGVWGGLWTFPEMENVDTVSTWCRRRVGRQPTKVSVQTAVSHRFTHFDLHMTPVRAHVDKPKDSVMEGDRWLWYDLRRPAEVGLAAPIARLLESFAEGK